MHKQKKNKLEISLMTILAHEATGDAQNILKERTGKKAKNYYDLEEKLANLYYKTDDKLGLEKEFAEIHPHKDWILKTLVPESPADEPTEVVLEPESKSNYEGVRSECPCPTCSMHSQPYIMASNFDGGVQAAAQQANANTAHLMMGMVAMVGVFGMIMFYAAKQK